MVKEFHIKNNIKYLKFFMFIILLSCSSSKITNVNADLKNDFMIKVLIKQTGIDWDAYYITLNKDCTYIVKKGTLIKGQDLSNNNLMFQKITDSQTINISKLDCDNLKRLVQEDRNEKR